MDNLNIDLNKVIKNDLCAGCGLCQSVYGEKNVSVELSEEGYYRPIIKTLAEKNHSIQLNQFCPGLTIRHDNKISSGNALWGEYKSLTLGNAVKKDIRYTGSSGGTISALLIYLLNEKIIDGVIHIGVSENNPILNEIKFSTTAEEVLKNSGSRYSPSAPLTHLNDYLQQDKRYVFVGKPCDVATLRMYAKQDKRVDEKILYMFSFFCAGVPSLKGTEKVLSKFNVTMDNLESFRYRGEGWPGFTKIVTKDGKLFTMRYEESWGTILNKFLQKRCKLCIDGIGEFSDIVCGDGWDCDDKGYPMFTENEGTSILITRNDKGENLLKEAINKGYIEITTNIEKKQLKYIQPFQYERRSTLKTRILAMKLMLKPVPYYSKAVLCNSSKEAKIKKKCKVFLGTINRIIKGRL